MPGKCGRWPPLWQGVWARGSPATGDAGAASRADANPFSGFRSSLPSLLSRPSLLIKFADRCSTALAGNVQTFR
jgi:hypothetical protein